MGRVEQNKLLKQQSLLESAFQLFSSKGMSNTSVSDIVNRAGMAKGTFYLYFHNKYDLQSKLISYKASQMLRHALDFSGYRKQEGTEDKIIAIIDDLLRQFQENSGILKIINKRLSWGVFKTAMEHTDEDILREFMSIIPDFVSEKEREMVIYTIVELVGSTCHDVILAGEPATLEEYKPYLYRSVRAIIHTYLSPKDAPAPGKAQEKKEPEETSRSSSE